MNTKIWTLIMSVFLVSAAGISGCSSPPNVTKPIGSQKAADSSCAPMNACSAGDGTMQQAPPGMTTSAQPPNFEGFCVMDAAGTSGQGHPILWCVGGIYIPPGCYSWFPPLSSANGAYCDPASFVACKDVENTNDTDTCDPATDTVVVSSTGSAGSAGSSGAAGTAGSAGASSGAAGVSGSSGAGTAGSAGTGGSVGGSAGAGGTSDCNAMTGIGSACTTIGEICGALTCGCMNTYVPSITFTGDCGTAGAAGTAGSAGASSGAAGYAGSSGAAGASAGMAGAAGTGGSAGSGGSNDNCDVNTVIGTTCTTVGDVCGALTCNCDLTYIPTIVFTGNCGSAGAAGSSGSSGAAGSAGASSGAAGVAGSSGMAGAAGDSGAGMAGSSGTGGSSTGGSAGTGGTTGGSAGTTGGAGGSAAGAGGSSFVCQGDAATGCIVGGECSGGLECETSMNIPGLGWEIVNLVCFEGCGLGQGYFGFANDTCADIVPCMSGAGGAAGSGGTGGASAGSGGSSAGSGGSSGASSGAAGDAGSSGTGGSSTGGSAGTGGTTGGSGGTGTAGTSSTGGNGGASGTLKSYMFVWIPPKHYAPQGDVTAPAYTQQDVYKGATTYPYMAGQDPYVQPGWNTYGSFVPDPTHTFYTLTMTFPQGDTLNYVSFGHPDPNVYKGFGYYGDMNECYYGGGSYLFPAGADAQPFGTFQVYDGATLIYDGLSDAPVLTVDSSTCPSAPEGGFTPNLTFLMTIHLT